VIVGFSSTGQSTLELTPNSGIGSNGLTLARNALLSRYHAETYPEVVDPLAPEHLAYSGSYKVTDHHRNLGTTVGAALLSPTKPYAPLIKVMLERFFDSIHSLVHCTGGGQTKIKRFGQNVCFVKDNLFPTPAIFSLIQEQARVPWEEMYAVFNMGHRLEACVAPDIVNDLIALASQFGIAAQVIGKVTSIEGDNEVVIKSSHGEFTY
jgi:phosphoribosylformylglycinamidine cyclo-ligase